MKLTRENGIFCLYKERTCIGQCGFVPCGSGGAFTGLCIAPAWRRRGYGSYLLKELLRLHGGYARETASVFTAPRPAAPEELAFWEKFDFVPEGAGLCRRKKPDLTAVQLSHDFLSAHFAAVPPAFCIDATCGNGGDTEFLCALTARHQGGNGRVLGLDVQPQAVENTRARLAAAGYAESAYSIVCDSHARLMNYAAPESADAVLFNFGWLPGAPHEVFSSAESSLPALSAALRVLKKGGVLSAVLYSGRVIGTDEKQSVRDWLRALPLTEYTVLECRFANWADTAPLPCFVLKK